MTQLDITNAFMIGKNKEYHFAVGQFGERWIGFAQAGEMIFVFSQISERGHLGLADREKVICCTGAVAQDFESGYGGIEEWFVEPALRVDPAHYRCHNCGELFCGSDDCGSSNYRSYDEDSYDDDCDDDIPGLEFDVDEDGRPLPDEFDLGPCCACEKVSDTVTTIVMLHKKNPEPGSGWGCFQCGLPSDGASAVVCDDCVANKTPIKFAVPGYLRDKKRIPVEQLSGQHEHDLSKHPEVERE